jgi:hypothetical protein
MNRTRIESGCQSGVDGGELEIRFRNGDVLRIGVAFQPSSLGFSTLNNLDMLRWYVDWESCGLGIGNVNVQAVGEEYAHPLAAIHALRTVVGDLLTRAPKSPDVARR